MAIYRVLEIIINIDNIHLLQPLKDRPTLVLKLDNFYKIIYYEPLTTHICNFTYNKISVNVTDNFNLDTELSKGWTVARDLKINIPSYELLEIFKELELHKLNQRRSGTGLELSGWIFNTIVSGLYTEQETDLFIKLMFLNGYSFNELVQLFTSIVKRKDLAKFFLKVATRIYREANALGRDPTEYRTIKTISR